MDRTSYDIGVIGLGVMGRNLIMNMVDHGFNAVGQDRSEEAVQRLATEADAEHVAATTSIDELVNALNRPRVILMMVPAGEPVDSVVTSLIPRLDAQDALIDGGNSHFRDTDRRAKLLRSSNIAYFGMGVSGGEAGARHGPSLMPGGPREAYDRLAPLLEAIAAHVDGDPCVTYLGPRSAGHFVKMVHNGIEYAVMQLIAESYDLMRRGLGFDNDRLHEVFQHWNTGPLASYLFEITTDIFVQPDDRGDGRLLDAISDRAGQKGTGMWTSQDALALQTPAPSIDAAVMMRDLSGDNAGRRAGASLDGPDSPSYDGDPSAFVDQLHDALHAAIVVAYTQGFSLLRCASESYEYGLDLADVARIWRGGCIIRAALLEDIRAAFGAQADLPLLMAAPAFRNAMKRRQNGLREAVAAATRMGLPVPALSASLAYYDAYRSGSLPTNLIQAQRDYFGSHTYERTDAEGSFHTEWGKTKEGATDVG
ncbi:MAG: NADP-dependent phosphogluconate dehydrogenase [Gemmatimonadota bacterium]|jgi:6-phosphogluconate dehydrogenase